MNSLNQNLVRVVKAHPWPIRVMHWLNVVAVFVMVGSGWRIYDNVPIFQWLAFPIGITLGGDPELSYKTSGDVGFANALLWHFAGMWLLAINGLAYLLYGIVTGRFRRKLFPIEAQELVHDVRDALRFRLSHPDLSHYNAVQKLLYVGVIGALCLVVLSGLAIWKPVQLQWLTALFGNFQGARLVHFVCMSAIVAFVLVHVTLALLVPKTLLAMVTGNVEVPVSLETPSTPSQVVGMP